MVDFLGGLTLSGGLTLTSGTGSSASSAKWIVVGAPYDDDEASDAGVAFVFDATNPSASPTKITANDAAAGDNFGTTVAVCGDMIAVGSPVDGNGTGSVYIFDGTDLSATPTKLVASDGAEGDGFGRALAISSNYIVVGAEYDDDAGGSSGSAYVFDATDLTAAHTKITANDAGGNDRFGHSVSVDGNVIVVGANRDDDEGADAGAAYVFTANNLSATPTKLAPSDLAGGNYFGFSVDTDGTNIVIGAPYHNSSAGAAYVYDASNLSSSPTKLTQGSGDPSDLDDQFGYSVAVDGDHLVVGAPQNNSSGSNTGCAYVYDTSDLSASPTEINGTDLDAQAKFGRPVSVSGDVIAVGVHIDNDGSTNNTGAAFVFDASSLGTAPTKIVGDQDLGDVFGRDSVAVG